MNPPPGATRGVGRVPGRARRGRTHLRHPRRLLLRHRPPPPPGGPPGPDRFRRRTTGAPRTPPDHGCRAPTPGTPAHGGGARRDRLIDRLRHCHRYSRPRHSARWLRLRDETRRSLRTQRRRHPSQADRHPDQHPPVHDRDARGQLVGVARGEKRLTDPIWALDEWLRIRPSGAGPLFTRVYWRNHPTAERIGPRAISRTVQERASSAGFDGIPVSGHSLRAGHATTAAVNGASIDRIAAQTRHRDLGTLVNHYIRPAEAMMTTTSRDLGL